MDKPSGWVTAIALAVAACGGSDEKALEPGVFGKIIAPPGELGKLREGMPADEARKLAPGLVPKQSSRSYRSGFAGMRYEVGLSDDGTTIDRIAVELPKTGKALLVTAWGPGIETKSYTYWLDPTAKLRAQGTQQDSRYLVQLESYAPLAELLGKAAGTFRFETTPVLGATVDALRAAYPALGTEDDRVYLQLPPTEIATVSTFAYLDVARGRISRISLDVDHDGHPTGRAALLAAAEAAWGKGHVADSIGTETVMWFDAASGRRAELIGRIESQTTLEVLAYTPLPAVLGDGADRLGFETTPLLGATWAEIRAAYPDRVFALTAAEAGELESDNKIGDDLTRIQASEGGGTVFELPPIDWSTRPTPVFFHLDAAGKVDRYAIQLAFTADKTADATIVNALKAKYGTTAAVERGDYGRDRIVLRADDPRVVARRDGIAWNVEVGALPEDE